MRSSWFTVLTVGAVLVAGCGDDPSVIVAPVTPSAIVRYINAVPDTVATDWRFIDRLTGSPVELALGFRGVGPYQAATPGARPLRVFPATTDLTTQFFFVDKAIQLDANKRYSLVHVGMTRPLMTPVDSLVIYEETQPTVTADRIAIRAMHLGIGIGNVDIYVSNAGGVTALPATPLWTNLAFLGRTPYVEIAPGPKTNVIAINAFVGGYSRATGTFVTDGFVVGQQITAAGLSPAANNGRSIINAINPSRTTGATTLQVVPVGFVRPAGSFIADGFEVGVPITTTGFTNPENNGRFYVTRVAADTLYVGVTTGAIALSATGTAYVRAAGSFITDGFYIGMPINATGFVIPQNNGPGVISNLTAGTLTLATRTPATTTEASAAGRTITRVPLLVPELAGAGRTVVADQTMRITKSTTNVPYAGTGAQSLVGELVYRATLTGTTAVIAEWTALTGLPADPPLGLEAIGGNTIPGSAIMGILMPRSVANSSAPQTTPNTTPPTPPFSANSFIFAVDKHPR